MDEEIVKSDQQYRETDSYKEEQTDGQTCRQTEEAKQDHSEAKEIVQVTIFSVIFLTETDRWTSNTERQAVIRNKQTDKQVDRHADRQRNWPKDPFFL